MKDYCSKQVEHHQYTGPVCMTCLARRIANLEFAIETVVKLLVEIKNKQSPATPEEKV